MIQVASLFDRILDDFFGPRGLGKLPHGDHVRPGLDNFFDLVADLAQVDIEVFQDVGGDAAALLDQAEQDVFRADVLVVEALGLLIGQLHHLAGTVGEAFIHAVDSDGFPGPVPVQDLLSSRLRHLPTHPAWRTSTRRIAQPARSPPAAWPRGRPALRVPIRTKTHLPRDLLYPVPRHTKQWARNPPSDAPRRRQTEPDSRQNGRRRSSPISQPFQGLLDLPSPLDPAFQLEALAKRATGERGLFCPDE